MKIDNLVKKIRVKREISQEEMARTLNVTANYISLIENGKKKPGLLFLKDISSRYNIPLILLTQDHLRLRPSNTKEAELKSELLKLIEELEQSLLNA